jgi:hypothetical protein
VRDELHITMRPGKLASRTSLCVGPVWMKQVLMTAQEAAALRTAPWTATPLHPVIYPTYQIAHSSPHAYRTVFQPTLTASPLSVAGGHAIQRSTDGSKAYAWRTTASGFIESFKFTRVVCTVSIGGSTALARSSKSYSASFAPSSNTRSEAERY